MPKVGKRSALRTCTSASAARRLASAWRSVWLAASTCGSSALSWASLKSVHQAPRGMASAGRLGFHSPEMSAELAGASL